MSCEATRTTLISLANLSALFKVVGGYFSLSNRELRESLIDWDISRTGAQKDKETIVKFIKWSFSASFLQLVNAFQWFLAGLTLNTLGRFPAQYLQMYYYAIFFASGSFLSAYGKGMYTITQQPEKPSRQEVWVDWSDFALCLKQVGGNEHLRRAKWFYEAFSQWENKGDYPSILLFQNAREFHTSWRNLLTYSLADMSEEIFSEPANWDFVPEEIILSIWHGEPVGEEAEALPEIIWPLSHMKAAFDLHASLATRNKGARLSVDYQLRVLHLLCEYHKNTSFQFLLREMLSPLMAAFSEMA